MTKEREVIMTIEEYDIACDMFHAARALFNEFVPPPLAELDATWNGEDAIRDHLLLRIWWDAVVEKEGP